MAYLGFIGAIIALIIIMRILAWPLKVVIKLLINIAIGILLLFLFNAFGLAILGFIIPINIITALVVGLLGIPGFLGVLLFCLIF